MLALIDKMAGTKGQKEVDRGLLKARLLRSPSSRFSRVRKMTNLLGISHVKLAQTCNVRSDTCDEQSLFMIDVTPCYAPVITIIIFPRLFPCLFSS